jgi:hypothetical protein
VQETFVRLWRSAGRFDPRRAWSRSTGTNRTGRPGTAVAKDVVPPLARRCSDGRRRRGSRRRTTRRSRRRGHARARGAPDGARRRPGPGVGRGAEDRHRASDRDSALTTFRSCRRASTTSSGSSAQATDRDGPTGSRQARSIRTRNGRTDVHLAAAVDPALYPVLSITAEPGDGDPRPSRREALRSSNPASP